MTEYAASFMANGKGMLVLDDYAAASVTAPPWPGLSFERYSELIMRSTRLSPYLSTVIVSRDTVLAGAARPHKIGLGVRMTLPAGRAPGDLRGRLATMASHGVTLAEWRANLPLAKIPRGGVHTDAATLAEGAAASLAEGITPLLTVAMPDLESHSQGVTHAATANALTAVSAALASAGIDPAAALLRVNMIVPGSTNPTQPDPIDVAQSTVAVLSESIDPALGGVVLLSGGQHIDQACQNLRAIAQVAHDRSSPWPITFGFTRATVMASLDVPEAKDEQAVHGALVDACERAFESASGSATCAAP